MTEHSTPFAAIAAGLHKVSKSSRAKPTLLRDVVPGASIKLAGQIANDCYGGIRELQDAPVINLDEITQDVKRWRRNNRKKPCRTPSCKKTSTGAARYCVDCCTKLADGYEPQAKAWNKK